MSMRMRSMLLGLGASLAVAVAPAAGEAQTVATIGALTQLPFDLVTPNPTGIKMYYYIPDGATAPMPIVLALHGCQGNASAMLSWLKSQADTYGFMLAAPFVNRVDQSTPAGGTSPTGCWDVGSDDTFANATAENPGDRSNSDPAGVYAFVNFVGTELMCGEEVCGDLSQVFATGQSSGAMMTNVMVGLYPDVFQAGAAYMGVPYGCWATGVGGSHPEAGTEAALGKAAGWSSACANGTVTHTGAEWAALLPPYAGTRPRMMIWHGESDTLINYPNFGEEVEQWTTALGVDPAAGVTDVPRATWKTATSTVPAHWYRVWNRTRYGEGDGQAIVEAIHVSEVGHEAATFNPTIAAEAVRFFGLGDSEAPTAPADLTSSAVTASGATLTWTASTDDVAVTGYVVYQVNGSTSTAVAWPTTTTYALTGLTGETAYKYEVAAVDRAGNVSAASTAAEFTTAAAPSGGGGGGGCGQGAPSGLTLALAAALLLVLRRRTARG